MNYQVGEIEIENVKCKIEKGISFSKATKSFHQV